MPNAGPRENGLLKVSNPAESDDGEENKSAFTGGGNFFESAIVLMCDDDKNHTCSHVTYARAYRLTKRF